MSSRTWIHLSVLDTLWKLNAGTKCKDPRYPTSSEAHPLLATAPYPGPTCAWLTDKKHVDLYRSLLAIRRNLIERLMEDPGQNLGYDSTRNLVCNSP